MGYHQCQCGNYLSLLLVWHAPLGECSAKCRHQSPEWMILSHINCFIRRKVVGFQILMDSLHPRTLCSEKTPTYIFFHISMSYL